jgi:hypothetical protein
MSERVELSYTVTIRGVRGDKGARLHHPADRVGDQAGDLCELVYGGRARGRRRGHAGQAASAVPPAPKMRVPSDRTPSLEEIGARGLSRSRVRQVDTSVIRSAPFEPETRIATGFPRLVTPKLV